MKRSTKGCPSRKPIRATSQELLSRPKPGTELLDMLTGRAAMLRRLAGDEMTVAALAIVQTRLALTPGALASMLIRELAPDWVLCGYEEQGARGVSKNTLTTMKQRGEIPQTCGGLK